MHGGHCDIQHGTTTRYAAGCRCDDCIDEAAFHRRAWRERQKASKAATNPPVDPWPDTTWMADAACAGQPTSQFFPTTEVHARGIEVRIYKAQVVEAKRLCSTCPVQVRCLEYALARPERYGIWGGATELERERMARSRRRNRSTA